MCLTCVMYSSWYLGVEEKIFVNKPVNLSFLSWRPPIHVQHPFQDFLSENVFAEIAIYGLLHVFSAFIK